MAPCVPDGYAKLLKVDANLKKDPALEFILDERAIPAKTLQAPIELKYGSHELVVLRNSDLLAIHQFEVGPKTGAEIILKDKELPPPGEDEPDSPRP